MKGMKIAIFLNALGSTIMSLAVPVIIASICVLIWGTLFSFAMGLFVSYVFVHEYMETKKAANVLIQMSTKRDDEAMKAFIQVIQELSDELEDNDDEKDN